MIEKLEWDSAFFGLGIGRITLNDAITLGWQTLRREMGELKLLYVFHEIKSLPKENAHQEFISKSGAELTDTKIVFAQQIPADLSDSPSGIRIFSEKTPTPELYTLALQSGMYSRFRLDQRFPPGSFEKMYRIWIENSVSGEMADRVMVSDNSDGQINGMITVSHKNGVSSIGLLAVAQDARGQKLGHKLVRSAMQDAAKAGSTSINVPTQLENRAACEFYLKNGFRQASLTEIYHLWK